MAIQDRHPAFSYPRLGLLFYLTVEEDTRDFVKRFRGIMRGVIIKEVSAEEFQAVRHLQATEGYLDLGMFEEAAEELRELDPAWFAFEETLNLQLRVFAGLAQG